MLCSCLCRFVLFVFREVMSEGLFPTDFLAPFSPDLDLNCSSAASSLGCSQEEAGFANNLHSEGKP